MSVFILTLIAMISMFIDHTAFWLVNNNLVMRNIGRLAFVSYCFLIAESYYHLKDKPDRLKKHVIKLLFLFVLSEVPYDLFDHRKLMDFSSQNVILTLLLGFLSLIIAGYIKRKTNNKTLAGNTEINILANTHLEIVFYYPIINMTNFFSEKYDNNIPAVRHKVVPYSQCYRFRSRFRSRSRSRSR